MSPNFDALTDCLEISSATPVQDIATEFVYFNHGQTTLENAHFRLFLVDVFYCVVRLFFSIEKMLKQIFTAYFA